ncbi:MAG TPA: TRAM domain-containing protein [Vicinamibacterales bacterium]
MSLVTGQQIALTIEKPASGGRMIARHLGQVVLVLGAIPGERVAASIERTEKHLAFATVREVIEPSPDRRLGSPDPLCGGLLYSHIHYERQRALKADVVRDAFARGAKHSIETPIDVAASPEHGYRMRARLHVRGARVGFYRENTHDLCDAARTMLLREETIAAAQQLAEALHKVRRDVLAAVVVTENVAASERAAHLELAPGATIEPAQIEAAMRVAGLRGVSAREPLAGRMVLAGSPSVSEPLATVTGGRVSSGVLSRRAESFFQANRFLLSALVNAVLDAVPDAGEVLDLYAGVGLFSVPLAALGHLEVTAVEGDHASGADLRENAHALQPRLDARVGGVEAYLASRRQAPATVIVDPPRTGMSKGARQHLVRLQVPRLVYVSCDPPTLARDARFLLDAGYGLTSVRAFDLFPNTPHVEAVAVFDRS